MVEKSERLIFRVAFEPESDATEFDRERVLVDAVDAVRDDIADCLAHSFRARFVLTRINPGQFFPKTTGGSKEKMARAGSEVTHF